MGPKYSLNIPSSLKVQGQNMRYNYDNIMTGLTSPQSMISGLGSNMSGNSSSNNSGPLNHFVTPSASLPITKPPNEMMSTSSTKSVSSNEDGDSIKSDSTTPKRKYQRHAKPDRNAPIRPPSAYIMFSNDSRMKLKDQKLSFAELAKIVGDQWKNMSSSEKQGYERRATMAKDEYSAALENYRQTDEHKRYQEYLKDFKKRQEDSNRMVERARKRAKQKSPGSGSLADASSSGNSTGNGSSGSSGSSGDTYLDKDVLPDSQKEKTFMNQPSNDYRDVEVFRHEQLQQQEEENREHRAKSCSPPQQQSNYRSNQMMRGMIPVELTPKTSILAGQKHPLDDSDSNNTCYKRRSARFNKFDSK
ncbi:unnamed protein product [Rhizopus stolonifer]